MNFCVTNDIDVKYSIYPLLFGTDSCTESGV